MNNFTKSAQLKESLAAFRKKSKFSLREDRILLNTKDSMGQNPTMLKKHYSNYFDVRVLGGIPNVPE